MDFTILKCICAWTVCICSFYGFVIFLSFSVFPLDLCSQFSTDTVETNFRHGVAPRGGVNAGNFYKSEEAKSFENCVESCCKSIVCNVAFYFNDDCLLISCNTTWPDGCEPEKQSGEQFHDSLWLTLRTLGLCVLCFILKVCDLFVIVKFCELV